MKMSAAYKSDKTENEQLKIKTSNKYRKPTEEELKSCRPCRLCLVGTFILFLVGLLVAAIVLIAVSNKCSEKVEKIPLSELSYQIYVKSFKDSDGDGYGDINGVISKLSYVKSLGVNTLILNDVISNLDFSLAANIGSLDNFKSLVAAANKKKMVLILQINPVITSVDSDWFKESLNGSSKRDWFIWRKKTPSNNWLTTDNKSAWHDIDNVLNQTFYSHFGKTAPTLNFRNKEVIETVKGKLRWWLDLGTRGFLMTAVSRLTVDNNFRSNNGTNRYDKDLASSHDLLKQLYKTVNAKDGVLWVVPWTTVKKSAKYAWNEDQRESDVVLNDDFALMDSIDVTMINNTITTFMKAAPSNTDLSWMIGGSSYKRLASRLNVDAAKIMSMFQLILPNKVMLYYGDEVLLEDANGTSFSIMRWNNHTDGGFSNTTKTWIQDMDSSGKYSPIKEFATLSKIRNSTKIFESNPSVIYTGKSTMVLTFGKEIIVFVNFGDKVETIPIVKEIPTKEGFAKVDVLFSMNENHAKKTIYMKQQYDVPSYQLLVTKLV